MIKPTIPSNEKERLKSLESYDIIDTLPEQVYDDLTKLAAGITESPISLVSLITQDRQWFKSAFGLDARETSRDIAFCAHAINTPEEYFEIADATKDERFHDNPLVTENPNIRFYGGIPLVDEDGIALGTLCVIDNKPKELSTKQVDLLKALSRQVVSQLTLRRRNIEIEKEFQKKDLIYKILSHDLKGPIGSYATFLDLIKEEILTIEDSDVATEVLKLLESMRKSSVQAYELIISLLEWANTPNTILRAENSEVDINNLISEIVELKSQWAEKKDIEVESQTEKNLVQTTDKNMLATIVRNLCSNAIKYTPSGGKILIEAKRSENGKLHIKVIDSGIGMDVEKMKKFLDYDNMKISRGTAQEIGYGIGLKVCRDLSKAIEAELKHHNPPEGGTVAEIIL